MHEIRCRRKVEFVDTDMTGIMHFSRYLVFMENTEHAFLAALGARVQWREGEREMTFPQPLRRRAGGPPEGAAQGDEVADLRLRDQPRRHGGGAGTHHLCLL